MRRLTLAEEYSNEWLGGAAGYRYLAKVRSGRRLGATPRRTPRAWRRSSPRSRLPARASRPSSCLTSLACGPPSATIDTSSTTAEHLAPHGKDERARDGRGLGSGPHGPRIEQQERARDGRGHRSPQIPSTRYRSKTSRGRRTFAGGSFTPPRGNPLAPYSSFHNAAMARNFVSRRHLAGRSPAEVVSTTTVAKAALAAPASKWIPTFASDKMFGLHLG